MIKIYSGRDRAGSSPEFWEENWTGDEFENAVRFCAIDPLRPLFEKYSHERSHVLEGGCGLGQYLAYYSFRGRRVIGLDFAMQSLKALRRRQPRLQLTAGDVSRLPFPDGTFDLYYSGGVVEHFEQGAGETLQEAARVLKPEGVLLVSVPYESPLRQLLAPFQREWRSVERAEIDSGPSPGEKRFFQYAYKTSEFEEMLRDAGLRVLEKQGYAIIWGIRNVEGRPLESRGNGKRRVDSPARIDVGALVRDPRRSLAKRLFVSEDAGLPLLGFGVRFMRWLAANMMMYVCVRADSTRGI